MVTVPLYLYTGEWRPEPEKLGMGGSCKAQAEERPESHRVFSSPVSASVKLDIALILFLML